MTMHTLLRLDQHGRGNRPILVDACWQPSRLGVIEQTFRADRLLRPTRKGMTDNEIIAQAAPVDAIILTRDQGFVRHWRHHGRSFRFVIVETDAANSKWPGMLWTAVDTVDAGHQPIGVVLRRNRREIVWE